jgi:hypothetical protein
MLAGGGEGEKNFFRSKIFPGNHHLNYGEKNFSGKIRRKTWPKPVFFNQNL